MIVSRFHCLNMIVVFIFSKQNMNNQSNINIVPVTTNAQVEHERPMMRRPLETVTCYKVGNCTHQFFFFKSQLTLQAPTSFLQILITGFHRLN